MPRNQNAMGYHNDEYRSKECKIYGKPGHKLVLGNIPRKTKEYWLACPPREPVEHRRTLHPLAAKDRTYGVRSKGSF